MITLKISPIEKYPYGFSKVVMEYIDMASKNKIRNIAAWRSMGEYVDGVDDPYKYTSFDPKRTCGRIISIDNVTNEFTLELYWLYDKNGERCESMSEDYVLSNYQIKLRGLTKTSGCGNILYVDRLFGIDIILNNAGGWVKER